MPSSGNRLNRQVIGATHGKQDKFYCRWVRTAIVYCPIVFYCEWINYDLLISSHFSEMFVIMVIYAHKWYMYFCKDEEAFITIRLSIATIIIRKFFFYCKLYSPAQFAPVFRVENFVLHVYTEIGFLAIVRKWVHVQLFLRSDPMLLSVDTLRL